MAFSLYTALIPTYLQVLSSVAGLIDKAEAFCTAKGMAPEELIEARLAEDMLPFAYQVKSTAVHSFGAIEAIRSGSFSPDMAPPPTSLPALRERIASARSALEALDPVEIDGFIGRDVRFGAGEHHIDFVAEDFLLSFSQPNFHFHAATAYGILRMKGVEIGKRDYLGQIRKKP